MTWSELLFAHWQVEPSCIAALLPPNLELDTRKKIRCAAAWGSIGSASPTCCMLNPSPFERGQRLVADTKRLVAASKDSDLASAEIQNSLV